MSKPELLENLANPEVERMVIWNMLMNPGGFEQTRRFLQVEDFTISTHQVIYRTACELAQEGIEPDMGSLPDRLIERNELYKVGTISSLRELGDGLFKLPNFERYCRRLAQMSISRRGHLEAGKIQAEIQAGTCDVAEALESASKRIRERQTSLDDSKPRETLGDSVGNIGGPAVLTMRPRKIIPACWPSLTGLLSVGGFTPGQLVILAGRPSAGKSAVMSQMATEMAIKQHPTKVWSLEMSEVELLQRIGSAKSGVDHGRVQSGTLSREELRRFNESLDCLMEIPLGIDDRTLSLKGILAGLDSARRNGTPYDAVFIDYLQLIDTGGKRQSENRTQEVSAITRALKLAAKEYNCVVFALSQMSRAIEQRPGDKRPQLSDLRDSGSIEQDADIVLFTHRPELYKPEDLSNRDIAELIVAKQRNGRAGPNVMCRLKFFKNLCSFGEVAEYGRDYTEQYA